MEASAASSMECDRLARVRASSSGDMARAGFFVEHKASPFSSSNLPTDSTTQPPNHWGKD